MAKIPVAVARGDGIGPEIMQAVLSILSEAGAPLELHEIEIGEKVYLKGVLGGIEPQSWDVLRHTKAFLKAPITTPQGGGFKSLNVTVRTTLGLYANVRPCVAYAPFVATKHPKMDLVIIRENEEDLYAGIEYRYSPDVRTSLKIISKEGCEKIIRYAFEYARHHGRKKVSCFTKDNIMKFSDGLFHSTFTEMAKEYPDIENEHWIVDIGAAKLADTPEAFDVIVLPNLYGDILSDVAAQISGSVGLAGSANIGTFGAMFEAIHGSAPRRAGQNLANPSGLLLGSILMLNYLGENLVAERIHNAWLATIEKGIHTYDLFQEGKSREKVGTQEFGKAVIKLLGSQPHTLPAVSYAGAKKLETLKTTHVRTEPTQTLVGVDVFVMGHGPAANFIQAATHQSWQAIPLHMITNRGVKVFPGGHPETTCIDEWRLRFTHKGKESSVLDSDVLKTLQAVKDAGYRICSAHYLYRFDGEAGYSSSDL